VAERIPTPPIRRRVRRGLAPIACAFTASQSAPPALIEPVTETPKDAATALNRTSNGLDVDAIVDGLLTAASTPIEPASLESDDLAAAWRVAEGIDLAFADPFAGPPSEPRPSPAAVTTPKDQDPAPAAVSRSPGVVQAIRLTRDAVNAWMQVLTTPPVVQVSRR
jgi:hypothetical protein